MKEITLESVLEIINRWSQKVAGCGNGKTVIERIVQELNQTYGK